MARVHPFEAALRDGLAECGVASTESILFAVSGGPDSMAMLTAMINLRRIAGDQVPKFAVAHFNHRLRGPESEGDARYVRDFCLERGIICEIGTGDVAAFGRNHSGGLEAASRTMRYRFLADAARRHGATAIATAHTRDDQAETILHHIVRGSGLAGLRGMQGTGPIPNETDSEHLRLVRPLLALSKSNTEQYRNSVGIKTRHDSSNDDLSFARNRIRHKILPELRELNPSVSDALVRLGEAAGADHAALEAIVDDKWDVATQKDGEVMLPVEVLNSAPTAVTTRLIQRAFAILDPNRQQTLEMVHIKAILEATSNGAGLSVELPAGIVATIGYENVTLSRSPKPIRYRYLPIDDQVVLEVPGWLALDSTSTLTAVLIKPPPDASVFAESIAYLDLQSAGQSLIVRNWIEGDRFQPLGMSEEKKLSDFFIDSKVPRDWRKRIPLVLLNDRIAWVAGYRIAEWAKVSSETRNCVRLELAPTGQS